MPSAWAATSNVLPQRRSFFQTNQRIQRSTINRSLDDIPKRTFSYGGMLRNSKKEYYAKGRQAEGMLYRFFKILAYPACMNEHRITSRHRVLKTGTIEFGGGAIDCTVRNLSGTGAALDVTSPVGIPDHFTLVMPADGSHKACHVVWRKEKRIGVAFEA